MATHGSVSAFDPSKEDWTSYEERLRYYFVANDVTDGAKKRSILLAACGAPAYKLIRSLVQAEKLDSTPYEELVNIVKNHYDPKPSVIMQRYKFNTRTRTAGELIAAYVAALRDLAQHCEFKETLSDMLRDRLVCGVNHKGITNRLLAEKALELAQAMESAERDTQHLQSTQQQPQEVHYSAVPQKTPKQPSATRGVPQIPCYRCGGQHSPMKCKFKEAVCHACKKRGHIVRVCRSKGIQRRPPRKTYYVEEREDQETPGDSTYSLFAVTGNQRCDPILREVCINQVPLKMELDTGAAVSVTTQRTYQKIAQQNHIQPLQHSDLKLKSYSGETIPVLGQVPVVVRHRQQECELFVHVVDGEGPDLMGRDWLRDLKVTLGEIHALGDSSALQEVLEKHSKLFCNELWCLQGMKVKLNVNCDATPKFFKARTVPLALKEEVEAELENLESMGIISPVESSRWAAPIVPVLKQNGAVRICGDYKVTVNQACLIDSYPLPRVEELLTSLSGGNLFSKLDMSQAYLQLPLDEESKEYVTVNTHKGLYRYNRLPFGISSAPSTFQRTMETLLQGIKGVLVYIDDILITGPTIEEHLSTLDKVLEKLGVANLRLNKPKCFFLQPSIEYLGHIIDKDGLHPTEEKVRAIKEAPKPRNISELRSFFGIINYYSRFLPNLSTKLAPLYQLLQKDTKWTWGRKQNEAFKAAKSALQDDSLLVHYDESKPLVLACDASQYGLGAVLSHVMEDGKERPVAYASRTLTPAEKNYSQIEKEGLAIIFGVKKFHNFLFGRHFSIESDHQPLSYLFSETKGVSQTASSRIQRWALTLGAYHYNICHKPGATLSNAETRNYFR